MSHHKSQHQIGLGTQFLNRATLIFGLLLFITLASFGTALYADIKVGFFKEKIAQPVEKFFSEVGKTLEATPSPDLTDVDEIKFPAGGNNNINITISGDSVDDEEHYNTPKSKTNYNYEIKYLTPAYYTPYLTPQSTYFTPYSYPTPLKSYDQLLKEQAEWSKQKQAENQAWFDQKVQESQKELEEWKKAHGF
ncbi:MAG: hypothetical protein AAB414_04590 [Patescibacteria group bacterium]